MDQASWLRWNYLCEPEHDCPISRQFYLQLSLSVLCVNKRIEIKPLILLHSSYKSNQLFRAKSIIGCFQSYKRQQFIFFEKDSYSKMCSFLTLPLLIPWYEGLHGSLIYLLNIPHSITWSKGMNFMVGYVWQWPYNVGTSVLITYFAEAVALIWMMKWPVKERFGKDASLENHIAVLRWHSLWYSIYPEQWIVSV